MNSLDIFTLVSMSSDCKSSFYGSCEVIAHVQKENLTVFSGDGNIADSQFWVCNPCCPDGEDARLTIANLIDLLLKQV
jgi:hypothetical protein